MQNVSDLSLWRQLKAEYKRRYGTEFKIGDVLVVEDKLTWI